jgi:hypothetical protein
MRLFMEAMVLSREEAAEILEAVVILEVVLNQAAEVVVGFVKMYLV